MVYNSNLPVEKGVTRFKSVNHKEWFFISFTSWQRALVRTSFESCQ